MVVQLNTSTRIIQFCIVENNQLYNPRDSSFFIEMIFGTREWYQNNRGRVNRDRDNWSWLHGSHYRVKFNTSKNRCRWLLFHNFFLIIRAEFSESFDCHQLELKRHETSSLYMYSKKGRKKGYRRKNWKIRSYFTSHYLLKGAISVGLMFEKNYRKWHVLCLVKETSLITAPLILVRSPKIEG